MSDRLASPVTDDVIERMLRARAGAGAPPDLVGTILERAWATRQRARPWPAMPSGRGDTRGRLLLAAALLALASVGAVVAIGSYLQQHDDLSVAPFPPPISEPTATTPTPTQDVAQVVHGWPGTSRNPAGVYSWDGSRCASRYCILNFMHNGYGSGDFEIRIHGVPGAHRTTDDVTAVTVAGHEGSYRRIDPRLEEWIVEIEGTTIAIDLQVRRGTSAADLAEAYAIIESMRAERQDTDLGFRLLYTLTTDDWDSG